MKRKLCPLLVQSDTEPSYTVSGASRTRTYLSECLGQRCAAYFTQDGFCERFQNKTALPSLEEAEAALRGGADG